jgi:hypothetical protein
MEINRFTDIRGVVVVEDIPEGRMVLVTANTPGSPANSFGSRSDLPGVKLPDDATEAAEAKYVLTWRVEDQSLPFYIPTPSLDYSLRRGGFDQAGNLPFTAAVHLTWPGQKNGVTIPSGFLALAFGGGIFTVLSGAYVYAAGLVTPGAFLVVANTADDGAGEAGKLKYSASSSGSVARVERYNSTTQELTFRTLVP